MTIDALLKTCSNQNSSQCLRYMEVTIPWVQYPLVVMSAVAIALNVVVIVWRLKRGSESVPVAHWSFFIVHLAAADGLFAVSRLASIAAMNAAGRWFQAATALTKGLCVTSFILNHFSVVQSFLIMAAVALFAVRENIGLFGKPKRCLKSTVRNWLIVFWIFSTSLAISHYVYVTVNEPDSEILNWSVCWDFFGRFFPHDKDGDEINDVQIPVAAVCGVVVIFSYTAIFFATLKSEISSRVPFLGFKLATIVFIDGVLLLLCGTWNIYFMIRYGNKESLMNEAGIYIDIANAYMYCLVVLLNPLIYTLWTKSFTNTFKCKRSKKEHEPGLIESHDVASIPNQQTRLFSDTSDGGQYGSTDLVISIKN